MENPNKFMLRAMELAEQGRGKCSPNPFVGAVIVKDGRIIGEGSTQPCGLDHAELQAIKNCTEDCAGGEIYVTLEPCSHYGKTPPCAKAIIESGIKKVYIGIIDPNPLVNGQGIAMLKKAGVEVQTGFYADEITFQLEYYLAFMTKSRPFVILKTAVSLDGRIAAPDGSSRWISCEESRIKTHELRQEADAVLTGIGTVLKDNPLLNVRLENPYKQPLRVIIDARFDFPVDSEIARTARDYKTLIIISSQYKNPAREEQLNKLGIEVFSLNSESDKLDLKAVLHFLHERKVSLVLLEAGSALNTSFLKAGLVDKLVMFLAPKLLGGQHPAWNDIGIPDINHALLLKNLEILKVDQDFMLTGYL